MRPSMSAFLPAPSMMSGLVLGDDDLAGLTKHLETDVFELEADLFADDLATGEDCHVLQHCLAAVAEARGLDGD